MRSLDFFSDRLSYEALHDLLDVAVKGAQMGIWDWDLRTDQVRFDRRWCEMLGLVFTEAPAHLDTWKSRVHPDDLASCYRDIEAHLQGQTARYENVHRLRHKNGEWVYILDRGKISEYDPEGRPVRFTGVHFDLTPAEKANYVLAQQDRQLRDLVANLPTAVALFDPQLHLLAASRSWCRWHNLGDNPPLERTYAEISPHLAQQWRPYLDRALAGESNHTDETQVISPRGPAWLRWDIRPWRTVHGVLGGVLLSFDDISETVERQHAIEAERTRRLAALSWFAAGIAHEMNTPLQVLSLEADLIVDELSAPNPQPSVIAESAHSVVTMVRRAAGIVNALRTLARDPRRDPQAPVGIGDLLRDAESLCRARFEANGVQLRVADNSRNTAISGCPAEWLQVLLSLLEEAYATVGPGGWVQLEADANGQEVILTCADSRLSCASGKSTPMSGPGLSLAWVRALAQRNGGHLQEVTDFYTRFIIRSPRASEVRHDRQTAYLGG